MKALFPAIAAAVGLGCVALPVAAGEPEAHADHAHAVPAKPDRGERTAPPVRSAMKATLQADGTLTYECLTVPHPKHASADADPTAQQLRGER
jgi:hypothetical protein